MTQGGSADYAVLLDLLNDPGALMKDIQDQGLLQGLGFGALVRTC